MVDIRNDLAVYDPVPDPAIVIAGMVERGAGYECRRLRGAGAWLVFYTLTGEGKIRSGGSYRTCRAGQLTFVRPGVPHHYFTSGAEVWRFYWVYFKQRASWSGLLELEGHRDVVTVDVPGAKANARLERAFRQIVADCEGAAAGTVEQELALCGVEQILYLTRNVAGFDDGNDLDPRIAEVNELMRTRFAEPLSLGSLARLVHLSPTRLAHLYKDNTGDTVLEALHRIRLNHAAQLLHLTTLTIAEIAERSGFPSVNFFVRKFRQRYGDSPSRFRQAQ